MRSARSGLHQTTGDNEKTMGGWKSFRTGLSPMPILGLVEPGPPYKGKGWYATIQPWEADQSLEVAAPAQQDQQEIIVHAKSHHTAQNALDLVLDVLWLFSGGQALVDSLLAWNDEYLDNLPAHLRGQADRRTLQRFSAGYILEACALAAKASFKRKYVHALAKHTFSLRMYSTHVIDLEPFRAPYLRKEVRPIKRVILCHSIIAAYSVIEELGLEVRASKEKPAHIDRNWNPEVRADLERRLVAAHVNLDEKLLWTARGPKRRVERRRVPRIAETAEWADGCVRDGFMDIVDAIAYASWLRSKVASHKLSVLASSLSPYDVANVQALACRLLQDSLGA